MRHPPRLRRSLPAARTLGLLALTLVVLAAPPGCADRGDSLMMRYSPKPMPTPVRAVWVARFHYHSAEDIREIMRHSAMLGFNTVLFQVRGDGTVSYPSRFEPWSTEYKHQDPGFDPLAVAVEAAHRNNLRIEAWINVMPGWFGDKPPAISSHLYHTRPHWFLHDQDGRRQPLNGHYVILNPCLPSVREHIVAICHEVLSRYAVDGLHLDYIRYAWDASPNAAARYPRDAQTLALYERQTGRRPDDDRAAWDHWRANQLTRLVDEIRQMQRRTRPGATLTAAVWGDPSAGYRNYLQNATAWLRAGLLDAAYPMAYRDRLDPFVRDIDAYRRAAPGRRVIPGIGAYKHDSADGLAGQLARCRSWGGDWAIFSYESLLETYKQRTATRPDRRAAELQTVRADVIRQFTGQ